MPVVQCQCVWSENYSFVEIPEKTVFLCCVNVAVHSQPCLFSVVTQQCSRAKTATTCCFKSQITLFLMNDRIQMTFESNNHFMLVCSLWCCCILSVYNMLCATDNALDLSKCAKIWNWQTSAEEYSRVVWKVSVHVLIQFATQRGFRHVRKKLNAPRNILTGYKHMNSPHTSPSMLLNTNISNEQGLTPLCWNKCIYISILHVDWYFTLTSQTVRPSSTRFQ